jgi:hypothetical protein
MIIVKKTVSSKDNMCNYCQNNFATCDKANHIKFGDGTGNDNVTECSELVIKSYFNNYPIVGTDTFAERIDLNRPS